MALKDKLEKPRVAIKEKLAVSKKAIVFNEKKKRYLIAVLALLVLGLAAFRYKNLLVVAVVNNRPITRWELSSLLFKQYGTEALQTLITKQLIFQEAKKQAVAVTQEDIDAEIDTARKEIEAQGGKLEDYLAMQGQTLESIQEQVEIRLIIEQILGGEIEISDEDAQEYFDENKAFFPEGTGFDEVKDEIKDQLKATKISEKFQEWMTDLQTQAKVYNFLQ